MKRRTFLALAGAAGSVAGATAAPFAPLRIAFGQAAATQQVRATLPNGLLVIVEERRGADTLAVRLRARAGSRDDGMQPGLAFLTLRAMLAGTARRPTGTDLTRAAAQVGGTFGGGAAEESSAFAALVPSREAELAFDLVSDVVREPLFAPDAFAARQQITLQDAARLRSDPGSILATVFQETMYAGHPLSTPTVGTPESIAAMAPADAAAFRDRYWVAGNAVLTVVGRITAEDALAKAGQFFGLLPAGEVSQRPPVRPAQPAAARTLRRTAGQQQAQFRIGFPAPTMLDPDRYPMIVLNTMTGGASGRLFREVRTLRGLAYTAGSNYQSYTDAGAWYAGAGVDPGNVEPALVVVRDEIQRLRDELPDAEEVADTISQIAGGQLLADETNAARADRLSTRAILGTPDTAELVARIRAVKPADVQRLAQTYFDLNRAITVIVGPA